jgi:uncharacterized protein YcbK (DUF882 family)
LYLRDMIRHLLFWATLVILLWNCNNLQAQGTGPHPKGSGAVQNFIGFSGVGTAKLDGQCEGLALSHDGKIRILVTHFGEFLDVQYLDEKGCWIPEAYAKIKHALRSRGDNQEGDFDKRLIELADHLQDHFQADTIDVISGYRSPSFNASLKRAGRGVAVNSRHTRGEALDVHVPNLDDSVLRDYLLAQKLGGVGYYKNMMVHFDFGPVRRW